MPDEQWPHDFISDGLHDPLFSLPFASRRIGCRNSRVMQSNGQRLVIDGHSRPGMSLLVEKASEVFLVISRQ